MGIIGNTSGNSAWKGSYVKKYKLLVDKTVTDGHMEIGRYDKQTNTIQPSKYIIDKTYTFKKGDIVDGIIKLRNISYLAVKVPSMPYKNGNFVNGEYQEVWVKKSNKSADGSDSSTTTIAPTDYFFTGIMGGVGILTGLGWAYKNKSSGWGYVGYAVLFLFIGSIIGGIIDSVRRQLKSKNGIKQTSEEQKAAPDTQAVNSEKDMLIIMAVSNLLKNRIILLKMRDDANKQDWKKRYSEFGLTEPIKILDIANYMQNETKFKPQINKMKSVLQTFTNDDLNSLIDSTRDYYYALENSMNRKLSDNENKKMADALTKLDELGKKYPKLSGTIQQDVSADGSYSTRLFV